MTAETAAKILDYSAYDSGGVQIDLLRNLEALKNYLAPLPKNAKAAASGNNTWIIKTIDGKAVLSIAAGAFSPDQGAADITGAVKIITLPETITNLGESLFAGAEDSLILDIPSTAPLDTAAMIKAAEGSDIMVQCSNPADPNDAPVLVVRGAPVLLQGPLVDYSGGPVTVSYTFNTAVTVSGFDTLRWDVPASGQNQTTITLSYKGSDDEPLSVELRAEETYNGVTKTADSPPVTVMPVTGTFLRPSQTVEYTLLYYDSLYNVVRLGFSASSNWYYVNEADTVLRDLFQAIYSPNAPDSTDTVEVPKQALPYTPEISRTVLNLFKITLGTNTTAVDIKGGELPAGSGDKNRLVIIDIGIPDTDNSGELPVFSIPDRSLGTGGGNYAHIRLRVNRGMRLDIGDNAASYGNLKNSTVEVMGNGRLWDNGYEGFLGEGAVVIVRLGAYLGAGSRSTLVSCPSYDDWLISPAQGGGKIRWGTGDQNGNYIEIRQDGKMAFNADLTVRKSLSLNCDVWFVNGPILTVDAAGDFSDIGGYRGLFAADSAYRFYGDYFNSGGENPSQVEAKIIVFAGSNISRSFLQADETDIISGLVSISNKGVGGGLASVDYGRDSIKGYPAWALP
jgi:hypothetical protein